MNTGLVNGITPGVWHRFHPKMKCIGVPGVATDPIIDNVGSEAYQTGQVLLSHDGVVDVFLQTQFVGNSTVGSSGFYAWSLPIPALRISGPNTKCPMPLGVGMAYRSFFSPSVNIDLVPTLIDPSLVPDDDDYWIQAFCPFSMDWGTATFTATVSTLVINHHLTYAPKAEDIEFSFTNGVASNASRLGACWVTAITSTSFTLNRQSGASGGAETVAWKIRAEPAFPTSGVVGPLCSPVVPWDWSNASIGNFFFRLRYRARH